MSIPTINQVAGWHRDLLADKQRLAYLKRARGLTRASIKAARLGYDIEKQRIMIPVLDGDRVLNVRRYNPKARVGRPKIVGTKGARVGWYAPPGDAEAECVIVAEGELDALLTAQKMSHAGIEVSVVSGTGGAGTVPRSLWIFRGKRVFIAYDCDDAGRAGARKLAAALVEVAGAVHIVELSLPGEGDDLTDWFVTHGRNAEDLWAVCDESQEWVEDQPADRRSIDDLLPLAVGKCGEMGSRNQALFWLACQLRDERYTKSEARTVAERFRSSVGGSKSDPFPATEVEATVTSAYSEPPRDAVGSVDSTFTWNDTGNAQRLVQRHGDDMRWVNLLGSWVCWNGARWIIDNTGIAERFAMDVVKRMRVDAQALRIDDEAQAARLLSWATRCGEAHKLAAMLRVARSFGGMTVQLSDFDTQAHLIAFRNQTVELGREGSSTAREHRREDRITRMVPADYSPRSKSPMWKALLEEKLPDAEVRRFFQKLLGVSLIGGNPEQMLVFAKGATNTSKSTVLEIVADVLGRDYAGTFNPSLFREKRNEAPRPDIINTILRRFLYVSELSSEWELHADVIKRMTGEDTLTARKGHGNDFLDRRPDWTAWIATNHSPTINGADKALWRRLYVIPFNVQHTNLRKGVRGQIVDDEAEGVLMWMLRGWRLYCREGLADVPLAVAEATMVLRESLSPFDRWLTACCDLAAEHEDSNTNLWESYKAWCLGEDVKTGGGAAFKQQMEGRFGEPVRRRAKGGADNKLRYWRGLRVRTTAVKSVTSQ